MLTGELAKRIHLSSTDTVLDIACGLGESARLLAKNYGCSVLGLDLSKSLLRKARELRESEVEELVLGDGEILPVRDDSFTVTISECSMCLIPEFGKGLREIFRILRPHGRLGITDIATDGPLPLELEEILAQFLCISNEVPWSDYPAIIKTEGFDHVEVIDESASLHKLLETIKKRLLLAELLTGVGKLQVSRDMLERGKRLVFLAKAAVDEGRLRYAMITAQKPAV